MLDYANTQVIFSRCPSFAFFEETLKKAKAENASHYIVKVVAGVAFFFMENLLLQLQENAYKQRKHKRYAVNLYLYAEYLLKKNSPPILDLSYLSEFCGIKPHVLSFAIIDPQRFYRKYEMPKRRGGTRVIEAPMPSLLKCQKWIAQNILEHIPIHENATAYRKGIGLIKNVEPHLGKRHLLKLDLKDFFHSIKINRVISIFLFLGYLPKTAYELASLCCLNGRLPQGAATSPILSNIIAKRMDHRLSALAKKYGLEYTRYSDDITFSGSDIPSVILSLIHRIIESEGYISNKEKTRLYTRPGKRIVTGISVAGVKPKLPRDTKKCIRKDFHELITKGHYKDLMLKGGEDVFFLESLKGRLSFWKFIEPESTYPVMALQEIEKATKALYSQGVELT